MNNVRRVVVASIGFAMLILMLASIPGFAETQEELKQMFVTREEFNSWAYSSGVTFIKYSTSKDASSRIYKVSEVASGGMSQVLESLEVMGMLRVQVECEKEMSIRSIHDDNTTEEPTT